MFSLVVLCCENYGMRYSREVVSGFESEEDAYEFAAKLLLEAGMLEDYEGGYKIADEDEIYSTPTDAVTEWSEGLGASEYFHVVPETRKPFWPVCGLCSNPIAEESDAEEFWVGRQKGYIHKAKCYSNV